MRDKTAVTAAIAGSGLVWTCLLSPLLLGALSMADGGRFAFDFLLPLELFPFVLVGACLLLLGALRAGLRYRTIGLGFALVGGFLIVSQVFAIVSGLASGTTEASTWQGTVLAALLLAYGAGLVVLCAGGIALLFELRRNPGVRLRGNE